MRVLFVASECDPWVKTGGLGDVVAALPAALARAGVEVRVCLPFYRSVRRQVDAARSCATVLGTVIREARLPSGVPVYAVDAPWLFDRDGGPYQDRSGQDWADNGARFGLFGRVSAILASAESPLTWRPDIWHGHDWQAGLGPLWLKNGLARPAASLMTIHNLAFQGLFPPNLVATLGLPPATYAVEGAEFYGQLSFLKAGLHYACALTTVSPRYACEIQEETHGCGLQGLLRRRAGDLTGIVNGIDEQVWDPARDPLIEARYDARDCAGKRLNKESLQRRFGLSIDPARPLLVTVSRLTWQKGIDIAVGVADAWVEAGGQWIVLGSGEPDLEATVRALADRHPQAIAAHIGFDETLAHRLEAGADLFLMPSRFEPCGLNQMYSQRYGTLPVARATGGLADTIEDVDGDGATGTGFLFDEASPAGLWGALARALSVYRDPPRFAALRARAMSRHFSWEQSAARYADIYERLSRAPC